MREAYSRLKVVLEQNHQTTADLVRKIAEQGDRINPKSIYRLAVAEEPIEKVDMRVIGAICQALDIGIGDIITFEEPEIIEQFSLDKQQRMDNLSARFAAKDPLSAEEFGELRLLVDQAEEIARGNARRLANRRRRLLRSGQRPAR